MSDSDARSAAAPISLRIPEAIRMTGIRRSRLYELMRDGEIDYAKDGSSTLILFESLKAYVERQRVRKANSS